MENKTRSDSERLKREKEKEIVEQTQIKLTELREGLKKTFFRWNFPKGGGGSNHFPQLSAEKTLRGRN